MPCHPTGMNTHTRPAPIPLKPDPVAARGVVTRALVRACAAHLIAKNDAAAGFPSEVVARIWPHDSDAHFVTRAAVTPGTTSSIPSLLRTAAADFLTSLGPMSAGSQLLARGMSLSFGQD